MFAVGTDDLGVDVDDLENKLQVHHKGAHAQWQPSDRHPFWAMVYLVPTFNNPQSSCLHPGKEGQSFYETVWKLGLLG